MTGEGLSPAARALLDAARGGMAPDAAAIVRMKAKVASAAGVSASAAFAIKLGLVAFVATLAASAAIYGNRARSVTQPQIELPASRSESYVPIVQIRAESPTTAASDGAIEMAPERMTRPTAPVGSPTAAERANGVAPTASTAADRANGVAPTAPTTPTTPTAPTAPTAADRESSVVSTAPTAPRRRADLAREVELVDLAMAALRRGDTAGALAAIRSHASETRGAGQLAEDAAAIEIEALCRRHDPSVAAKLDAFDARFPRSAQRSRLSDTCP